MSDVPRTAYAPRYDATPEAELDALAHVYALALQRYEECHANRNAAGVTSTNGDDAMKGSLKHEVRANGSIP